MVDAIDREAQKAGMTVEEAMVYQLEKAGRALRPNGSSVTEGSFPINPNLKPNSSSAKSGRKTADTDFEHAADF